MMKSESVHKRTIKYKTVCRDIRSNVMCPVMAINTRMKIVTLYNFNSIYGGMLSACIKVRKSVKNRDTFKISTFKSFLQITN